VPVAGLVDCGGLNEGGPGEEAEYTGWGGEDGEDMGEYCCGDVEGLLGG
jgi:hypothetical protein